MPKLLNRLVGQLQAKGKTKDGYGYVKKPFKKDGELVAQTARYFQDSGCISCVAGPYSRVHVRAISLDSTVEVKDFLLDEGWIPAKGKKRGKMSPGARAKDREAKYSGKPAGSLKYNPKTNRATKKA